MWERLTAPEDGFSKLQRENLAIIESYGKALMEVVCRDACDGHEISRVRSRFFLKEGMLILHHSDIFLTLSFISCICLSDLKTQSLLSLR